MRIYVEASHTGRSGARTGIQTVVRGLVYGLAGHSEVFPARWSFREEALTPLKPKWEANLDHHSGKSSLLPPSSLANPRHWPLWAQTLGQDYKAPLNRHPAHAEKLRGAWIIIPELMQAAHTRALAAYAAKHGMRVAGIFHDAIPWLHPELVFHRTSKEHEDYMEAFAALDVVIAVSEHSAEDFRRFTRERNIASAPVHACGLAAEIFGQPRETKLKEPAGDTVKMLCVSTLEPRKNHATLLAAFEEARALVGGKKLELHLVGGVYEKAPEIADSVRAAVAKNGGLFWHESVGHEGLRNFYRECDFTVFASWIEGFGLPVIESLWFGRPCLCSDQGVIAENAKGGGCLMVETRDAKALAAGMVKLATQPDVLKQLGGEVLRRKLKTWNEYGAEILAVLEKA